MREASPEEPFFRLGKAEGDQRIDIALSCNGAVEDDRTGRNDHSGCKSPQVKQGGEYQDQDAHEFHGVSQLKAGLRIAGNGYKGHIKHGLTVEPPGFYSVFSKDDTGNNTERGGQHVGSIDCCQAKSVDGKFQDQKLPDQGDI